MRIRPGDFIQLTLKPERGEKWEAPTSLPSGFLVRETYRYDTSGTLHATFRARTRGHGGLFATYDCGPGRSCPSWSVKIVVH